MNDYLRVVLATFFLVGCYQVYAQGLKQDEKLLKGRLDNGLTYYLYPNRYPEGEAVYRLFIKSGSVFEKEEQKGLAHFLEHMAFNGSRHFPGDEMIRFLESKGAKFGKDLNAHTSFNETVYKLQLPSQDAGLVDTALTIMADWAGGLLLDSLAIEKERGVIFSEWLSKSGPENDARQAYLLELLNNSQYSERIVIGDTAVINHCPQSLVRDYYREWYRPELMAVAVSGDIDVQQVEEWIRKKFSFLTSRSQSSVPRYAIDDYEKPEVKTIVHESLSEIELNIIQLTELPSPVQTEADYKAYVKRSLFNRLFKSRLNRLTFNDPPYKKPSVGLSGFLNVKGVYAASANLVPGKIEEGIVSFLYHLEQVYRYGFTSQEINKEKAKLYNQVRRSAESKSPVASMKYMDEIYTNFYRGNAIVGAPEEYRILQQCIHEMDSVGFASMLQTTIDKQKTHYLLSAFEKVCPELPDRERLLFLVDSIGSSFVEPFRSQFSVPEALLEKTPDAGRIVSEDDIPEIEARSFVLSNGAKVFFKRSVTDKNKIAISGFRKGGLYAIDSTLYVSGVFAGNVVGWSGAGAFSREALSYYLAGNTASVRLLIDKTRSGFVGGSDMDDAETLFQLLHLKWMYPKVDSRIFAQTKKQYIEAYQTKNRTGEDAFYKRLSVLLNGENYVTRELTDSVVEEQLLVDSILPVFRQYFSSANGYTFIILADCPFEEIRSYVLDYIGSLPDDPVEMRFLYNRDVEIKAPVLFEEAAGTTPKAKVSLIFQTNKIDGGIRLFNLKNELIKSALRMKLLAKLREEMGMVYSVSVSTGSTLHPTPLSRNSINFVTAPEQADLLIQETIDQLKQMVERPESFSAELNDAKKNLIKEMTLEKQKNSFWSGFIRNSLFDNETDWSFPNRYEQIVHEITVEELARQVEESFFRTPMVRAVLYPKK